MRLVAGGTVREGRAVDATDLDCEPGDVLAAIRGEGGGSARVDCPDPGPAHAHVGCVRTGATFELRAALAAAARSRGRTASVCDDLARARERLESVSVPEVDLEAAREAAAEAGTAEDRLREEVAARRGRLRALREAGAGEGAVADAERELRDAAARLSEAETERLAAEQRLARARRRAREARDARERRLRLQDRVANLRRRARAELAGDLYPEFAAAVRAVPVPGDGAPPDPGGGPGEYAGDTVSAMLATARVAALSAPVVLAVRRFSGAGEAASWLDAPVVRL